MDMHDKADYKGILPGLILRLFILAMAGIFVFGPGCSPPRQNVPEVAPDSTPGLTEGQIQTPSPMKSPPRRHGEDEEIRLAKQKYIPRHVWDVAGSPSRVKEIEYLRKAVTDHPQNPEPVFLLAFVLMEDGQFDESKELYKKVLKMDKYHRLAWENITRLFLETGETKMARNAARSGLNRLPGNPRLTRVLGQIYLEEKQFEFAEECFRHGLAKNPDSPHLMTGLAEALHLINPGDEEALKILEDCTAQNPRYPDAYLLYGEILSDLGRYGEAIDILQRGMEKDSTFNDFYRLAGEIYYNRGEFEKALEMLEKSQNMAYRPDDPDEVAILLARVMISLDKPQKAVELLDGVIDKGEDESTGDEARLWKGVALVMQNRTKEAREIQKETREDKMYEALNLSWYLSARIELQEGNPEEAVEYFDRMLARRYHWELPHPRFRLMMESARALAMAGQMSQAEALLIETRKKATKDQKEALDRLINNDALLKGLKEAIE